MKIVSIYISLFLPLIFASFTSWGQQAEQLKVTLQKSNNDSCCVYNLSIRNESDSTVCILHSMFMNLTSSEPQGLALYQQSKSKEYYSLHYSVSDTAYNFESVPYRAECILPHQTLGFKIQVYRSVNEKVRQLSFDYLYISDFCYKNLMKDMQKMTTWYLKYKPKEKIMELFQ